MSMGARTMVERPRNPKYTVFQLYYMARETRDDLTYATCEVYTSHKYTHHLCPHHDTILINERWSK